MPKSASEPTSVRAAQADHGSLAGRALSREDFLYKGETADT
jgi:hypothetical protein